jgi:hypothetical protein
VGKRVGLGGWGGTGRVQWGGAGGGWRQRAARRGALCDAVMIERGGGVHWLLLDAFRQEEEHLTHDPRRSRQQRGAGAIVVWTRRWSGVSALENRHWNCNNDFSAWKSALKLL